VAAPLDEGEAQDFFRERMTEPSVRPSSPSDDISLLSVGTILLRRRRMIVSLGMAAAILAVIIGLSSTRLYVSSVTIVPQSSEGGSPSGLALAASQLGIRVPGSGGTWGPPVYVELLRSWDLLEPLARDTFAVTEEGGRRIVLMDLLEAKGPTPERRIDVTVRKLRLMITATEVKTLGAVRVSVSTRWPSVSLTLAERLVSAVNRFNLETRRSQASAERQFVEQRAAEAERSLREAEDRLQAFLQRNRSLGSPELTFHRDRLQREIALRQQAYMGLVGSREEARIREVRDTPTITVLQAPRMPLRAESRRLATRGIMGGFAGGVLGVLIALLAHGLDGARRDSSPAAREFFRSLEEASPRVFRWGRQ
jgi:uncharacterized protein involved in exopolysaccharide biosynthesis